MNIFDFDFHDKIVKKISVECNKFFMDEVRRRIADENGQILDVVFTDCIEGHDSIREWVVQGAEEKIMMNSFIPEQIKKEILYVMFNFNISNSTLEIVSDVTIEQLEEAVKVYNLGIEDSHTYYVSDREVLVHNDCGDDDIFELDPQDINFSRRTVNKKFDTPNGKISIEKALDTCKDIERRLWRNHYGRQGSSEPPQYK